MNIFVASPDVRCEYAMALLRLAAPLQRAGAQLLWGTRYPNPALEQIVQADLVVIQRDFPRNAAAYRTVVEQARRLGKAIVYEIDDLLLELPADHPDRKTHYYTEALFPMLAAALTADTITVVSASLQDYFRTLHPNVIILPNYFDDQIWTLRPPKFSACENLPVKVGYMGGGSHEPDLCFLLPVFKWLLARYGDRITLKFWGVEPPVELRDRPRVEHIPLDLASYSQFAAFFQTQECDIFVAPLQDNRFNRCKSAVKFFEYTALGVPGIYSRLEPYETVVVHGQNGFLATTVDEWLDGLARLIESPQLRYDLAAKAQESVRLHWLLSEHAHEWVNAYRRVAVSDLRKPRHLPLDVTLGMANELIEWLNEKDVALQTQMAEIHRLERVVTDKDAALQAQMGEIHRLERVMTDKDAALRTQMAEIHRLECVMTDKDAALQAQMGEIHRLERVMTDKDAALQAQMDEMHRLNSLPLMRLQKCLSSELRNLRKIGRVAKMVCLCLAPVSIRRWLERRERPSPSESTHPPYHVRLPSTAATAPVILHAIANLMTGGSSRLVVDLVEHLGNYHQPVLTSFLPEPPAYVGLDVEELPGVPGKGDLEAVFARRKPALVHMHYWGECDRPWYEQVMSAAERHGIPVLENINTPVAPLISPSVRHYVYVSEYVRNNFGRGTNDEMVIHPGSDYARFAGCPEEALEQDSVGMVYRLEDDKLGPQAIDSFVAIAKRRPTTRIYIVGGGSYLEPYRESVAAAGVLHQFVFTGYVAYESLPEWYRKFGVFVAPVFKESFGQVSTFAMSMGIPVVGYATGAIPEIIDNPDMVVPTGNHDDLAEIVCRLLADKAHRLSEGRRQQELAHRQFAIESMVAAYQDIYRRLLPT